MQSIFITMYPYCDAGQFSNAGHCFLLRHYSWIYPFDAGQFSDASQPFFYYVTIHGYIHFVMWVNFLMQVNGFFYHFHYPWVYPYRDVGQFSDASQQGFFYYVTIHGYTHIVMRVNFLMKVNRLFNYVTIHGYTHIVMWVNYLMQVNRFFCYVTLVKSLLVMF